MGVSYICRLPYTNLFRMNSSLRFVLQLLSISILLKVPLVLAGIDAGVNVTDFVRHRQERSLLFAGGGTIKLVIGMSMPVTLADPIAWRSLVNSINLHGGQYTLPTKPLYPWDKWETIFARSTRKMRERLDHLGENREDDSRLFVYTALEAYMSRAEGAANGNGRACVLRSICENAQVDQHVGVFAEMLNIVLTPGNEKLNPAYSTALEAGKSGADCLKLYWECPRGANILDQYLDQL